MVGLDGRFDPIGPGVSVISLLQAFGSLLFGAVLTGLLYGRFSSPTNSIVISENAVITQHEGKDCLMFRIANSRQAKIKV